MAVVQDNLNHLSFKRREDADGRVWVQCRFSVDGVKNTPGMVVVKASAGADAIGYHFADLADNTQYFMVGVPNKTQAVDTTDWIQIGGQVTSMIVQSDSYVLGYGVVVSGGVCDSTGAAYANTRSEFAVAMAASSSSTDVKACLIPREVHQGDD